MTQACPTFGLVSPGVWPGVVSVFRFRNIQPAVIGTTREPPLIWTTCVSAGKNGLFVGVKAFSASSNATMPRWLSGYQGGLAPHVNGPWLTFESRQTIRLVPPSNGENPVKRAANVVASGCLALGAAAQLT